jgi:hypothetical protein
MEEDYQVYFKPCLYKYSISTKKWTSWPIPWRLYCGRGGEGGGRGDMPGPICVQSDSPSPGSSSVIVGKEFALLTPLTLLPLQLPAASPFFTPQVNPTPTPCSFIPLILIKGRQAWRLLWSTHWQRFLPKTEITMWYAHCNLQCAKQRWKLTDCLRETL